MTKVIVGGYVMTASPRRGCLKGPECHEGADQVVTRGRASGQGVQWQAAEEGTDLGGTSRKADVAEAK